jgi:hypothetical protein
VVSSRFNDVPIGLGLEAGDRRAAVLLAEEERAALRRSQIEAQSSPLMTAEERIRLWESLHGLSLPRDLQHKLVHVIATNTGLSAREVRDEQLRRNELAQAPRGAGQ